MYHPALGENGEKVEIVEPSIATPRISWTEPNAIATYSVSYPSLLPQTLNGVPFETNIVPPRKGWSELNEQYADFEEPPYPMQSGKRLTSGCVILEPDWRVWIVHPTNRFADIASTFPKGRLEEGLSLVANAVKESWEESGLWVEPVTWLCDIERTKTLTRYYIARRIAGSPEKTGWESQAVSLVPLEALPTLLNRPNDRRVLMPLFESLLKMIELNKHSL